MIKNSIIYNGKVIHRRFKPKEHYFKYNVFSLLIDIDELEIIENKIKSRLKKIGIDARVEKSFSPPWTTDWISSKGRKKLEEFGIAPPQLKQNGSLQDARANRVKCPQCSSLKTEKVSEFGSTACKSLYRCLDCKEPFDHFKCI